MSKGGAHFTSQELALVLSHYDIGIIQQIKHLIAGSNHAPKQIIVSDKGKYFLKRRSKGKTDHNRIEFAHCVQNILKEKKFPVSKIITTKGKNTFLELDNHIYELFEFASGARFDGRIELVENAGLVLAKFHSVLKNCTFPSMSQRGNFHNSNFVREHLGKINSENNSDKTTSLLITMYNNSSVNVNNFGFDNWPNAIVHGDWHPGNMLFAGGKISAVFDFDSLNVAPVITDVANGAIQFSIVAGRPDPADWPDYIDQKKFVHFICGYCGENRLDDNQLKTLPDLMIETLIAEAVLPIAATGSFSNFSGSDFLKMIQRKCLWIDKNRNALIEDTINSLKNITQ